MEIIHAEAPRAPQIYGPACPGLESGSRGSAFRCAVPSRQGGSRREGLCPPRLRALPGCGWHPLPRLHAQPGRPRGHVAGKAPGPRPPARRPPLPAPVAAAFALLAGILPPCWSASAKFTKGSVKVSQSDWSSTRVEAGISPSSRKAAVRFGDKSSEGRGGNTTGDLFPGLMWSQTGLKALHQLPGGSGGERQRPSDQSSP